MKIREAQKFSDKIVDVLTEERKKQNLSRYKIAKNCGLTEAGLCYIEHHDRRPTIYTIKMIADALNIKLSDVIKKVEENENQK